jgi:phosphate transport system permease protein
MPGLNRKYVDSFFKYLFRIVSFFSVLALASILFFVFSNGVMPFFTPTAKNIRLVLQRIDEISVNGVLYKNHSTFIDIPTEDESISLEFEFAEEKIKLDIAINKNEKDPDKSLTVKVRGTLVPLFWREEFVGDAQIRVIPGNATVTNPEAYVYTITWPAAMRALDPKIHIILPEPPYSFANFIFGLKWQPNLNKVYGIFPMIVGTIFAAFGAILLGVPIALLCAVFMAEFLSEKMASIARSCIELLAGIPSVVYGFFGLMVIVPAVRTFFHIPSGNTLLSAIIVLALMILPTVITIAETSLRAVPLANREASLSLGASKMQTAWRVVLPHAHSGVIAGIILGISRAVGETMAVILVSGNSPQLVNSPLESIRTLTATIAMEMGYASGRHSEMLFSIGVVLFIIILVLNSLILWVRRNMEAA